MNTVQKAFDELAAQVLDSTMSERQVTESRRMFFAGAAWMLAEFESLSGSPNDPEGILMMNALAEINAECLQFGKDIAAGLK